MADLNVKPGPTPKNSAAASKRSGSTAQGNYCGQVIGGNDKGRITIGRINKDGGTTMGPCLETPDGHHQMYMDIEGERTGTTTFQGPGNFNIVHGEKNVEDDTTIFIEATNGDLIIKAHNGKIRMYGTDIEMHATGSSDSSKGNIRMTASENIELNAKKIVGNAKNMLKMVSPGTVELAGNSAMNVYGAVLKLVDDSCMIKNSQNNLQLNVIKNLLV